MKKNWKLKWAIEFEGYLGMILLFLSIWLDNYRWKLFFTGMFLWVLAILNFAVLQSREKEDKLKGDDGK